MSIAGETIVAGNHSAMNQAPCEPFQRITVAIPTYNRPTILNAGLLAVAGNLPHWVRLVIIDNHSPEPVALNEELRAVLASRGIEFRIIRNAANIGGGANILRCFEYVEDEWFVLCGDDDILDPAGLGILRSLTETHPDAAFIKFSSRFHQYSKLAVETGIPALLAASGEYDSLLFMSSFAFNRIKCSRYLRFGYLMNGAYAPHLAVALLAARDGKFIMCPAMLAKANECEPAWSPVDVILSAYYLSDLPISGPERSALTSKIYSGHSVGRELLDVITIMQQKETLVEGRFLRRKGIMVHLFHGNGMKRVLALLLLMLAPLMQGMASRALRSLYKAAAKKSYTRSFVTRHDGL